MASVAVGPISSLFLCLVPHVWRHICYVVRSSKNVEKLKTPMEKLTQKRADVQGSVDAARRRGEVIKEEVQGWLERVDSLQTEVTSLMEENRGCLQEGCFVRYREGKGAHKKIITINKLQSDGQFADVSYPAPLPGIDSIPTPDFESFQSTESTMKEIMRALQDEKINLVGVYGLGGVGKTTIVKELGKRVQRDGLFDEVVMATVSQHPVVKNTQREIAENLGMRLEEESEPVRGRRLFDRLKQAKQILLILDDLWAPLELADIGIPFGNDSNEQCKVVLTTRSLDVCSQMGAQVEIEVRVLTEPDAWSLFQKNAGDRVASTELHIVAKEVAKECRGLPIALVTLGRALRNKDPTVWTDAARRLKNSSAKEIAGMHAKVFSSIRLSYEFLDNEETRVCFLLCCLLPEDYVISEEALFPYVIGERVFKDVESLMEARDRLHTVLDKLQALCLLLKVRDGCVKMHDVVRDVAIEIARQEDHGFEVKAGRGLEQWPDMENLERCKRLSLMKNEISMLPNRPPDSSQLMTLSLQYNWPLKEIPDRFFEGMTSLTTLDLSFTSFSSLPQSISYLTNLRVLDMTHFRHLTDESRPLDVSLLGNLKKLEVLNLRNCGIRSLPEEIGGLTKLKSLNLSRNRTLTIPPNLVSQLSRLEELDMINSFDEWEIEESEDGSQAYFSEVASLTGLTKLWLHISNVKVLFACIPIRWKNLARFSISVGYFKERFPHRTLSFNYETKILFEGVVVAEAEELSDWFKMLLGRTETMAFNGCNGLKNVLQVIKILGSSNSLKALKFESCGDLEYLLNTEMEKPPGIIAFNSLEVLKLYGSENLKEISRGPLPNGYFNKLSTLHVMFCNLLTNVLNSGLIAGLPNLEIVHVFSCKGLTEIFNSEGLEGGHAPLMKLRELQLVALPKLVNIWKGVTPPYGSLQKLESLEIVECNEMVQIVSIDEKVEEQAGVDPIEKCRATTSSHSNLSNLRSIPNFHNLKFLFISGCHKLKHFLPLNLAQGLLQLENIRIVNCNDMEKIFVVNGETDEGKMTLPKLKILRLENLPKLLGVVMFSSQGDLLLDLPSLGFLCIEGCPNLKSFRLDPQNRPLMNIEGDWIGLEDINKNRR